MPKAPTAAAVGLTSGTVVSFNSDRAGLVLINTSSSTIYLGLGNAAVVESGISLNPNGGTWVMDEYTYTNMQVNGIAASASCNLAIQEFNAT